jgi:hypothetical protein
MTVANFCPFSSSEIFFAAEVWPLKNASQFAVICALALPDAAAPELLDAGELAGAEGTAEAEDADAALDGSALAGELEPLLQAAIVAASAKPSAGAAIRRARSLNRMTSLRCLGRMSW